MEQVPPQKIGAQRYQILWHQNIRSDLTKMAPSLVEPLVAAIQDRLSRAPQLIGQPLKGTTNLLWKIRFSKYRVIYTINTRRNEVWVLSVQKRDWVYRDTHVQSLLHLAVALQEQINRGAR